MITKTEYIKITNRVKISAALGILRDVLGGDDYGVSEEEMRDIRRKLSNIEDRLFGSYDLVGDEGKDVYKTACLGHMIWWEMKERMNEGKDE